MEVQRKMIYLGWLLFAHCIGDMVFQTNFIAQYKGKDWLAMLSHLIIYTGTITLALVLMDIYSFWKVVVVLISHWLIDNWKSKAPKDDAHWHYLYYDQGMHLIILIIISLTH